MRQERNSPVLQRYLARGRRMNVVLHSPDDGEHKTEALTLECLVLLFNRRRCQKLLDHVHRFQKRVLVKYLHVAAEPCSCANRQTAKLGSH